MNSQRRILLLVFLPLFLALCAILLFNSKEQKESPPVVTETKTNPPNPASLGYSEKKPKEPTQEERKHASAILDFYNQAETAFAESWFAQADRIAFFIHIYLGEWQLAILKAPQESRQVSQKKLLPKNNLFSAELTNKLTLEVNNMGKALESMLADYKKLSNYVQDPTQDEGVLGKRLANGIKKQYLVFCAARKQYFAIMNSEAQEAEEMMLEKHPLKRQILTIHEIFHLFNTITEDLCQENINRPLLRKREEQLRSLLEYAQAPPFKDTAAKEQLYRTFLKSINDYVEILAVGNEEGFFPDVLKMLNNAIANCRQGYNAFAAQINQY